MKFLVRAENGHTSIVETSSDTVLSVFLGDDRGDGKPVIIYTKPLEPTDPYGSASSSIMFCKGDEKKVTPVLDRVFYLLQKDINSDSMVLDAKAILASVRPAPEAQMALNI